MREHVWARSQAMLCASIDAHRVAQPLLSAQRIQLTANSLPVCPVTARRG